MKKLYCLILIILLVSCNSSQEAQFDWLLGNWERTNDAKGNKTFEYWSKKTSTEYSGLGFTLKNNDTIFKETIRLIKEKDNWVFIVSGVNEKPTHFPLTSYSENEFTCENPENDFPKKISYKIDNNQLKATISDSENSIDFYFKRL